MSEKLYNYFYSFTLPGTGKDERVGFKNFVSTISPSEVVKLRNKIEEEFNRRIRSGYIEEKSKLCGVFLTILGREPYLGYMHSPYEITKK